MPWHAKLVHQGNEIVLSGLLTIPAPSDEERITLMVSAATELERLRFCEPPFTHNSVTLFLVLYGHVGAANMMVFLSQPKGSGNQRGSGS